MPISDPWIPVVRGEHATSACEQVSQRSTTWRGDHARRDLLGLHDHGLLWGRVSWGRRRDASVVLERAAAPTAYHADDDQHDRAGVLVHLRALLRRTDPAGSGPAWRRVRRVTQQLERSGFDESDATLPALDGDRSREWDAFANVYQRVESELPANQTLSQALASATIEGMVASLQDNHAAWFPPAPAPSGKQDDVYGLGFQTTVMAPLLTLAQAEALAPLYVTAVVGGAAAHDRLRAGDEIVSVNGSAPFVDGQVWVGVIDVLYQSYPQHQPLRITFHRPATGRTWTARMTPTWFPQPAIASKPVSAKLVDGDIAYVKLSQFAPGAAQTVLNAISRVRRHRHAPRRNPRPAQQRRRGPARGLRAAGRFRAQRGLRL